VATYQSIFQDNLQQFRNIFGQDQYLNPDSAAYQFLAIISLKQAHQNQALQLVYNQSSPQTAVGAGLDRVVRMSGLARLAVSYSTVDLNLSGTAGAVITNGTAQDTSGNLWNLPASVTLDGTGQATVTATCATPGAVAAAAATITIIATPGAAEPVGGWTGVTNPDAAILGVPTEEDSQLRARQAVSVALPSLTALEATLAAVLAIDGVTRVAPGYPTPGGPGTSIENPTGGVDSWGNPEHSISMVVEGGTDAEVAQAIYSKKTPGAYTNGSTAIAVTSSYTGMQEVIRFYRPTYEQIFILCTLTPYSSPVTSSTLTQVQTALLNYLASLSIGETVSVSALIFEAMSVNAQLNAPAFGVASMLIGALTAQHQLTTTAGSTAATVDSATGLAVGQLIVASSVPSGTTISAIAGTNVTLSKIATDTATISADFATVAFADLAMPTYYSVAQGAAADTAVVTP
jgi:uncharacterized phage protein gp47/JayE